MINHQALSVVFRVITSRPFNRTTLYLLKDAADRFGFLLPREMFDGLDSFFFRDATGNIDLDGDGVEDSFRLAVTNGWFDQRITGIEYYADGRSVPPERIIFRYPGGQTRASDVTALEFRPGDAMEIIAMGLTLADGLHFIDMTLEMELASQIMPALPVLMQGGGGDFAILDDCMSRPPEFPPAEIEPGTAHVVPHIHYDVEWLQPRSVFEKVGDANLREALRLMEEDPEMTFVVDQVPQLEPFRRSNREGFERLAALVEAGRVEPVNGMYCEPDTNLVSGESLVRQSLSWQRYALERFGGISRCGWLIDSFGMSAQLPQIFARSGVEFFAYTRAAVPEGTPSEFIWEGLDGTRILTHNMPKMYNVGHPVPTDRARAMSKMLRNYLFLRARSASGEVFYPGGVDHGRPQKEYGEMARAWNEEVEGVTFKFSLPSRFFEALPREKLPVVTGEFQREHWGTASARIELKKLNRACEFALLDAEKLSTMASLSGAPYPVEELDAAWRSLMNNHFHDQICGCCTDRVAQGMQKRFEEVLAQTGDIMIDAARHLLGPAEGAGGFRVLAFNPLSRPTASWVELETTLPPGWREISISAGGKELPVQMADATRYGDGSLKRVRAGFRPELPALGYGVFEMKPGGRGAVVDDAVIVSGTAMDNGLIWVEVDGSTGLLGRAILADGTEFDLSGGNYLTLEKDFGNLYEVMALGTTFLRPRRVESVRVIESGPLRGTIEVKGRLGRSPFTQRVSLTAGSPRIDLETEIQFRNRGCRLRVRFPTEFAGGTWTHEIPYGCIERPPHELAAQNFTDLSGGGAGVTLTNFGVPGNKRDGGTIFLTLLRSTDKIFLWESGPLALELGHHLFRYALYPHGGDWREAGSVLEAYRHNDPPRAFVLPGGSGDAEGPVSFSAVDCRADDVLVSVLKRGENGEVVLRLWETAGRETSARLNLGWDAGKAFRADLLERRSEPLDLEGGSLTLSLGPFEIATLVLE